MSDGPSWPEASLTGWQVDATHTPPRQLWSQAPQWSLFETTSRHLPPQLDSPGMQEPAPVDAPLLAPLPAPLLALLLVPLLAPLVPLAASLLAPVDPLVPIDPEAPTLATT